MIEEIVRITTRTCVQLLDVDDPLAEEVRAKMTSPSDLIIIRIASRKRKMKRYPRVQEIENTKNFKAKLTQIYALGYVLKGSNAYDGGGALPLSEESALNLAIRFFEIIHETGLAVHILLVRNTNEY